MSQPDRIAEARYRDGQIGFVVAQNLRHQAGRDHPLQLELNLRFDSQQLGMHFPHVKEKGRGRNGNYHRLEIQRGVVLFGRDEAFDIRQDFLHARQDRQGLLRGRDAAPGFHET